MDSANAASAPSQRKSSSLPARIASAAILAPGLLLVVWLGGVAVYLAATLAVLLSLREIYAMFARAGYRPRLLSGLACALLMIGAAILIAAGGPDLSGAALACALLLSLGVELLPGERENTLPSWALTLAGALYVGWTIGHLVLTRALETPLDPGPLAWLRIEPGAAWIYTIFGITWVNDSAAYLVGRRLGRHRMSPYISPKKSWEGAVGGVLGAMAWAVAAVPLLGLPVGLAAAALLGFVGAVGGVLGDLAESLLKRQAGVKDSGTLIPGHGGILDRIDSLLFVGPLLFYLIVLLT
jgi:phosphatidate cytidylyltransferase